MEEERQYLVVGKGGVLGEAWHQRGRSEHVVDEAFHQLKEAVSRAEVQGGSEDHVRNLQVQLSLKQRGYTRSLICARQKEKKLFKR